MNWNHLFFSKIFQSFIYFLSKTIVFFINSIILISSQKIVQYFIWKSINIWYFNHFSCLKSNSKIWLLIIIKQFFFSTFAMNSISIFQQNFQYWQFHIRIWIIFYFWKVFKNHICLFSELIWIFVICDEVDNISNSNFRSIFQIFHIFVQYFDKKSILKLFVFFEIIAKSYLFYWQKILFFSIRRWIQYIFIKNDKNFLTKFCINIRYWIYSLCLKIFRNHIQSFIKTTLFFQFENEFDIQSKTLNLFKYSIHFFCSKINLNLHLFH